MRVSLAQINPTVGAFDYNYQKIGDFIARAQKQQADIVIFPELAVCGYPPEDLLFQPQFLADNLTAIKNIAKYAQNIVVVIGFVDHNQKGERFNAAAVLDDGKVAAIYHKQCLPNYGVFDEKRYFTPGQKNMVFNIGSSLGGITICEDIWEEQGPWKKQIQQKAGLLINISSSPYEMGKFNARKKIIMKRARCGAYVCYVNLVGGQDELIFDGLSLVVNPQGKIIGQATAFEEDLLVVDIDVPKKNSKKAGIVLKNINVEKSPIVLRGIEKQSEIEKIYKALVLGARDYVFKNGFQKAVIGISGGIDSALVAAIAVEALGAENVYGVSMPTQFNSSATKSDAREVAQNLGINFKEIPIESIVESFEKSLEGEFKGTARGLAEENIQARVRGNLLMALSNKFGWLVLTTGNKSEIGVGYCTLYGDMSGGFAVIKDVPKSLVYELVHYCNQKKRIIPTTIIERAPSAELRPNQKDQDSLPAYNILDEIMEGYVEKHFSVAQLNKKFDKKTVKDVIRLIDRSEYKRRQAPPGIKITPRAFGKDWRLPITNGFVHNF